MTDNIDKNEIRKAIDRLQLEHPCHFAFDATKFDSTDNIDVIKMAIDAVANKRKEDADINIICEMAKLYLDGVRPTVKRPHGEWEQIPEREGEYYFYHKCTNCGQTIESGFNPPLFNFCPSCGTDMRKEGDPE